MSPHRQVAASARDFVGQPKANAGFAPAPQHPSLNSGERHAHDHQKKIALLARLRTSARKTAAQPRQLQTGIEEAPRTRREKIPRRPRTPTRKVEKISSSIAAKGSATPSRPQPP
jgi:hypothetical protein